MGCDLQVVVGDELAPAAGGTASPAPPAGVAGAGGAESADQRPVFGPPRLIEELSVADAKDQDPTLTADGLEIFFFSERTGEAELWTARRAHVDSSWEPPTQVMELASPELDMNPSVSGDGLRLWFHSQREPSGVYFTERSSRSEPWAVPVHIEAFGGNIAPAPSASELRMAISILANPDDRDILETTRSDRNAAWGPLFEIPGLNGPADDSTPFLVDEGRTILFSSSRTGFGDLYWARRPDFDSPVNTPEALTELNVADALETHPHLSPDGQRIFFGSTRTGVADLYEAIRLE